LGIYQGQGKLRDISENVNLIELNSEKAAQQGAHLIVFPEMWLTGYNIKEDIHRLAIPLSSPIISQTADIAKRLNMGIVYGYPEREGDNVYNSAIIINEKGQIVLNYRKSHLYGPDEKLYFKPGNIIPDPVLIHKKKIGIGICYDLEFPEFTRILAMKGSEIVVFPTANWDLVVNNILVQARAVENGVVIAYVNRTGQEGEIQFPGVSSIVNQIGQFLILMNNEPSLSIIELQTLTSTSSYLQDRRFELYAPLSINTPFSRL